MGGKKNFLRISNFDPYAKCAVVVVDGKDIMDSVVSETITTTTETMTLA